MAKNPAMPSRENGDRNNDKQTKMMFNILLGKESRLEIEYYSATFPKKKKRSIFSLYSK